MPNFHPGPHPELHPRLREMLGAVTVDADRCTARVQDAGIEADSLPALRRALANKLYEVFHAGLAWGEGPRPRTLRDQPYERLLAAAVPHGETTLRIPAASLAPHQDPAQLIVTVDGVRTVVPATAALGGAAEGHVTLRYPAARPALSAGFFLVDGSAGRPDGGVTLRLYLHIEDAQAAPDAWGVLLRALEEHEVPYRAKVSSSRLFYPRHDAIVVYLGPRGAGTLTALTAAVAGHPGLGQRTSAFARELAPGLAIAYEPSDGRKGMTRMSFGQHRAHVVAEGLVDQATAGTPHAGSVEASVCRALVRAGARPDAPWLNAA